MSDDLTKLKRAELDRLAQEAGVPNPDDLPNKEAVVEAIETQNPALVPDPDPAPGEQVYRVYGVSEVFGHAPGSTFTAVIPPEQASLLLGSGHIVLIKE